LYSFYVEELSRTGEGIMNVVIRELFKRRSLASALRRRPEFRPAARLHDQSGSWSPMSPHSAALRGGRGLLGLMERRNGGTTARPRALLIDRSSRPGTLGP
jgi:hypothetical protein